MPCDDRAEHDQYAVAYDRHHKAGRQNGRMRRGLPIRRREFALCCTAGRCSHSGARAQTYSVLGATGQNAQITFNVERITLAEAIAEAGGLQDLRSDPTGVSLFRFEPPAIVTALNTPQLATEPDRSSPVVYRLDMSDANAYFLAQRFTVEDKNVIYVANARLNELQKFFTLLNTLTGPVITGLVVKNAAPSRKSGIGWTTVHTTLPAGETTGRPRGVAAPGRRRVGPARFDRRGVVRRRWRSRPTSARGS